MDACIGLARAETHTGTLEWFNTPITELSKWIDKVNALERRRNK
jgi:hypothetical protein